MKRKILVLLCTVKKKEKKKKLLGRITTEPVEPYTRRLTYTDRISAVHRAECLGIAIRDTASDRGHVGGLGARGAFVPSRSRLQKMARYRGAGSVRGQPAASVHWADGTAHA